MRKLMPDGGLQEDGRGFAALRMAGNEGFVEALPDISRSAAADGRLTVKAYIDIDQMPLLGFYGGFFDWEKNSSSRLEGFAG